MSLSSIEAFCTDLDPELAPESQTDLVCIVCLSDPAGETETRKYVIEFNDTFTEFTLWLCVEDDWSEPEYDDETDELIPQHVFSLQSRGYSDQPMSAGEAAQALLSAAWHFEVEEAAFDTDFSTLWVDGEGLLDAECLRRLADSIATADRDEV